MIRVLVYRFGDEPKVEEVENPFLFAKHSVTRGGHIEYVNFLGSFCVLEDEEAPLKKMPINKHIPGLGIQVPEGVSFVTYLADNPAPPGELGVYTVRGNFIISKRDDNGHHVSLSQEEVINLVALIDVLNPKCAFCKKNPPAYRGAVYCGAGCAARAGA